MSTRGMIQMELTQLYKGLSFLKDENLESQLKGLEKQLRIQSFNLPVIGQFSAGKSMLLNNLLGQEVLPVKVTETTAFITYIAYGNQPGAVIRYKDGSEQAVELEYIQKLHQGELEAEVTKLGGIQEIHVKYPHAFLENGLCLIDTPGVNTLFAEHERLTRALLEETYYMVYVMAKPLTQYDMIFIKSIMKTGVQPIFVRTGIDQIKTSEERMEDALRKERAILEEHFGQDIHFYPITNKYKELNRVEFTQGFEALRQFLQYEIIANRDKLKAQALESKLGYLKNKIKEQLIQKQEQFKVVAERDSHEVTKAIEAIEGQIYKLELEGAVLESECTYQFKQAFEKLKMELNTLKKETIYQFEDWLDMKLCMTSLSKSEYEDYGASQMSLLQEKIKDYTEKLIKETMKANDGVYEKAIMSLNQEMTAYLGETFKVSIDAMEIEEFTEIESQKQMALREELEEVEMLIKEKERFIQSYQEEAVNFVQVEEELKVAIAELSNQIKALENEEIPQIYIEENTTVSDTLKTIGNIIDWATVVIPAKAPIMLGKKAANVLQKAGKACKQGGKVGKAIQSASKILKSGKGITKNIVRQSNGLDILKALDFFSVEFYLGKVGEFFDTPPRYEVDQEALALHESKKAQLTNKYDLMVAKKIENLQKSSLLKTQVEEEAKIKALKEEHRLKLQQELSRLDEALKKERMAKERTYVCQQITAQFKEMVNQFCKKFESHMSSDWESFAKDYTTSRTQNIMARLENLKEELQRCTEQKVSVMQVQKEIEEILQSMA